MIIGDGLIASLFTEHDREHQLTNKETYLCRILEKYYA